MPSPRSRLRCVLFACCASLVATVLSAQQDEPPAGRDVLTFTCTILGQGSDPDVSEATTRPVQNWTYQRVMTGWFEVETKRRRVGRGKAAHDRIEWTLPKGGAHQIVGQRRDWARNAVREIGEGGSYADYTAEETLSADLTLPPPQRPFSLVLEVADEPTWVTQFLPIGWLPAIEAASRYEGKAEFVPGELGGFGDGWRYFADDAARRSDGERHIDVRFHAGANGDVPFPVAIANKRWPASFDGKVATGHVEVEVPRPAGASGEFRMRYQLDWSIRAELEDVELEVRSPNYETWRPTAGLGLAGEREAGPALYFVAELRRRDTRSKKALPKIRELRWRLVDTSREPGVAMNWPPASEDRRLDLELVAGDLTPARDDDNQELVLRPDGPRGEVAVFPFDFGGWATLRVEALLDDGRTIDGLLLGAPGAMGRVKEIPVPARPPGSKIAVSWLRARCPGWSSDAADDDHEPAGRPGIDGDGFTVYQEYRGFRAVGQHLSTNPARKDLFVNPTHADMGAVQLFGRLCGLDAHIYMLDSELAPGRRVMNGNVGAGPSTGPQHGIVFRRARDEVRPNDKIPPDSRPGTVEAIEVFTLADQVGAVSSTLHAAARFGEQAPMQAAVRHLTVQALFQVCGVDRPGVADGIHRVMFVPADPATGAGPHMTVDGEPAVIEFEDGRDFLRMYQSRHEHMVRVAADGGPPVERIVRYYLIGEKGGAHSGPVECLMRDHYADLYRSSATQNGLPVFRFVPSATDGERLGTTRSGTGINAPRTPEPCFGDSRIRLPANRQLVVRDNAR